MSDKGLKAIKIDNSKPRKILLPSEGETVAISSKSKTAALCYDKVLDPYTRIIGPEPNVPDSIRCCGESSLEIDFQIFAEFLCKRFNGITGEIGITETNSICNMLYAMFPFLTTLNKTDLGVILKANQSSAKTDLEVLLKESNDINPSNPVISNVARALAKSFSEKYGISVAVVCASGKERDALYKEGDREVVATVLSNLEIVDEKKLTWQQVMEFRKDKISLQKYRRLLHWLDKEMIGKSQAFIEDDIAQKLVDYESTLKKHGLKTVLGTIEEVLDGKYLLGASGVVGSFSLAGYPGLGVLAGTGLMVGKMAVKLGNTWLDYDDAERGANSEISWVYEVKEQLKK
ncbi:MAG: hypothetical protein ABSB25_09505 [Sedimentisphaerales bacterium]|jgi:hypothetical protein